MLPSLHTFLSNHNLERYHEAFVKTGATDQDLLQLLHFNDEELSEFLQAVDMLPFHAIKFKRGLRELRVQASFSIYPNEATATTTCRSFTAAAPTLRSPLPTRPGLDLILNTPDHTSSQHYEYPDNHHHYNRQQQHQQHDHHYYYDHDNQQQPSQQTSREVIISHATIYGKNNTRPLTSYEAAINEAAIQLALDNPSLLVNKGNLFEMAKKKLLDSGYQYKRGKSRSKLTKGRAQVSPEQQVERRNARRSQLHAKRKLNAQRMSCERQRRIEELQTQLMAITERQRQYPEEFTALEATRTTLNKEISKIKAQERKHQWYERRKSDRSDVSSSDDTTEEEQQANDDDERSVASLSSAGSSSVTTASSSTSVTVSQPIAPTPMMSTASMGPMTLSRESDVRAKVFIEPTIARSELLSSA
ncbi:hypothetical protein BDB00DRAFT_787811 [Zychaea mexicana]|uniref:uncharacterized protein n=1 Tax=Zychaea mexicana TaxID=64656 RepID=UPI0022FE02F5|nr:uncharacterized protein BDB00DRAFT_787811 [Zychaea mexicana]KAI9493710.1 hypothetical protein BDB00DRAFT_787811 [Zychaea mexicana]